MKYTDEKIEELHNIYDETENIMAPEELADAYSELMEALEKYLALAAKFEFNKGFRCAERLGKVNKK